jgi:hypothetical protein
MPYLSTSRQLGESWTFKSWGVKTYVFESWTFNSPNFLNYDIYDSELKTLSHISYIRRKNQYHLQQLCHM